MHLTNWKARRAGGRITVTGTDAATGQPGKIVGVDYIEPRVVGRLPRIVAVDKNAVTHTLQA